MTALLEGGSATAGITLNQLMERTEGKGIFLVMVLLCLPFAVPFSIPGLSPLFGTIIIILSLRLALALPPRLPRFLGEKCLPHNMEDRVVRSSVKVLRFIERATRPRAGEWMLWPAARIGNCLLVAFMAFLLALPLPPFPPLTNTCPGYAIIFLAVAMMEEDGVLIWVGYAVSLGTSLYFLFMGRYIVHHLGGWVHHLALFLGIAT